MNRRILLTTDVVGGVWDFCVTLAGGLRQAGDRVVLLALGTPAAAERAAAAQVGADLRTANLKLEWMADSADDVLRTRELVAELARDVRPDVLHANQFATACAQVDVPVVLTLHSDVLSWRTWTLGASGVPEEWRPYASLVTEAVARADEVVAVSHFLADETRRLYAVRRAIDVIHNGWPAPEASTGEREPITVAAGRIWDAAKSVGLIAEAAVGWNPGPVYLAGETRHPDGGHATLPDVFTPVGLLSRADLDALLGRAQVYVSAARYDPFGLLPLQAALHGCTLVLSDIPSYREVWGDTALYFRSGDAADLRRQWQRAMVVRSNAAQARAAKAFSVERMVGAYRRLYARAGRTLAA